MGSGTCLCAMPAPLRGRQVALPAADRRTQTGAFKSVKVFSLAMYHGLAELPILVCRQAGRKPSTNSCEKRLLLTRISHINLEKHTTKSP